MTDYLSFAAVALLFCYGQRRRKQADGHNQTQSSNHHLLHVLQLDESERLQLDLLERHEKWDYTTEIEKLVRWMPKVELHVHFDGSWDPTMIYQQLLLDDHLLLPEYSVLPWDQSHYPVRKLVQECKNEMHFHSICTCRGKRSLFDMLKAFEVFLPLVRGNLPLLETLAVDFCKRQAQQHVVYTEMRYSPHLLASGGSLAADEVVAVTSNGTTSGTSSTNNTVSIVDADPVVDAITRGLRRGEQEYGVKVNQILCAITWRPDWADDVVRLAEERRHDAPCAVVGVDIAAGEDHFDKDKSPHLYYPHLRAMQRAKSLGIPITLHAGEVANHGDDSIRTAIHDFGARRIGHGYRMSRNVMKLCREMDVHIEVCPTSSVETGGWKFDTKDWKDHPAVHMVRQDVPVSLSSDDPSVFDTSLTWQWRIALGKMGLSLEELKQTTRDAIDAAFLSEEEKGELHKVVEQHLPHKQPSLLQLHSFCDRVSGVNQTNMENC